MDERGHVKGKGHPAEVVKANVHKEGTKQRQFLPSLSILCGVSNSTSDIAEKQEEILSGLSVQP